MGASVKDDKLNRQAKAQLIKKFQSLALAPSEVASTTGD